MNTLWVCMLKAVLSFTWKSRRQSGEALVRAAASVVQRRIQYRVLLLTQTREKHPKSELLLVQLNKCN
jgi:hypothetical protein